MIHNVSSYNPYAGISMILGGTGSMLNILNAGSRVSKSMQTAMALGTDRARDLSDSQIAQIIATNRLRSTVQNYLDTELQQFKKYVQQPSQIDADGVPKDSWQRIALNLGQNGEPMFLAANKIDIQNGKVNLQIIKESDFAVNVHNAFSRDLEKLSVPNYSQTQKQKIIQALKQLQPYYQRQQVINTKKQLTQMLTVAAGNVAILQNSIIKASKGINSDNLAKNTKEPWQKSIQQALLAQHPFTITATVNQGLQVVDQLSSDYLIKLHDPTYQDPVTRRVYTDTQRQMLLHAIQTLQNANKNKSSIDGKTQPSWLQKALNDQKAGIGFSIAIESKGNSSRIVVKEQDIASNLIGPDLHLTRDEKKPAPEQWMRTALNAYSDRQPYMITIQSGKIKTTPILKFDINGNLNVQDLLGLMFPEPNLEYIKSAAYLNNKLDAQTRFMGFSLPYDPSNPNNYDRSNFNITV